MKVFLTGATGYLGSVIAEKLKEKDYEILGLARNDAAEAKLKSRGITPFRGDLEDLESLKRGAREADAFIHTAFQDFSDFERAVKIETAATAAFADALANTNKPFITTSGVAFLGDTGETEADEDFPYDRNSPFISRAEAEQDALKMSQREVRSVVLRLPLFVYGRGGSGAAMIIELAREAGAANYIGAGDKRVAAVHVEDAADLYLLALETSTAKNLYNVGAETVSIKNLNEAIARLLDVPAKSISIEEAQRQFGLLSDFFLINNRVSSEKARRELGWKPKAFTTIADDIENGSYRKYKE